MRKRDRFFGKWRKPGSEPPSTNVIALTAAKPSAPSDVSAQDFLADVLKELTEQDREIIREHITTEIGGTIQAAYDAAEKQKTACEEKRWPGSDTANKVLRWLDRFKSVGDIVANVDPIHVGLPWAGVRLLLGVAVADIEQMSSLLNGMNLVLCFANRLEAYIAYYQHLPSCLTTNNFRKSLIALYSQILQFLAAAIRTYTTSHAVRKLKALWQTSDIEAFESQCDKLGARADIAANNCDRELRASAGVAAAQWKEDLNTTLSKLDGIELLTKSLDALQVKAELSKLIRVSEATYNSLAEGKLSLCLKGTRVEVLHQIEQWMDDSDEKPIFWLCGMAGTGKSAISRTIARKFDEQQRLGATFFFKRGEGRRSNANHFFSTISAQLADKLPGMREPISRALNDDSFLCGRGLQEQFEKLLLLPLRTIDSALLSQKKVAIVVDALDECDKDTDIQMFLRLLAQVETRSALQLRIFLTSRPQFPIKLGFQKIDRTLHQDIKLEEVQVQTIERDIRAYFDHEFTKIKQERLLWRPDDALPVEWPSEKDMQTLVGMAVPLFIFATTVCRFVSESKPQSRLQMILSQRNNSGTSHLGEMYLTILEQLLLDKDEETQGELLVDFREIVGTIVLMIDPLSVSSLGKLLGIDRDIIHELLDHLHSVLQIPQNSHQPVRVLHLSFRDFLVDPKRKDKGRFWVDEAETHDRLATHCLRRLNEAEILRNDICSVAELGIHRAEVSTEQVAAGIPPDIAYACSYWPQHLLKSGKLLHDDSQAYRFLQRHFLHWLEALSWLGRLSSAIYFISDLLKVVKDNDSSVADFLGDARRFILQNRFVVDLAPLQVYHSAMIFAPTQSIIRKAFHNHVPHLWAQTPKLSTNWSAELQKLEAHQSSVLGLAFSPSGQYLGSASRDGTVRLWNAVTGEQAHVFWHDDHPHKWVSLPDERRSKQLAFSSDGQFLAILTGGKGVQLWSCVTNEKLHELGELTSDSVAMAFSPDGEVIALASTHGTTHLWHIISGKRTQELDGRDECPLAIAFTQDGRSLALVDDVGKVQLISTITGSRILEHASDNAKIDAAAFSPCGQTLAMAGHDYSETTSIQLKNVVTGKEIRRLVGQIGDNQGVNEVAFSPDGRVLALVFCSPIVVLFDTATGELLRKFCGRSWQSSVAFSPEGRFIASGSSHGLVHMWDLKSKDQTSQLEQKPVVEIELSPDGQFVSSHTRPDGSISLWNATTGKQVRELASGLDDYNAVALAFSPNSEVLAMGAESRIRLFNTATGMQVQEFEGHEDRIRAVLFLMDGHNVVSASMDGTLRSWSTETSKQAQRLQLWEIDNLDANRLTWTSSIGSVSSHGPLHFLSTKGGERTHEYSASISKHSISSIVLAQAGEIVASVVNCTNTLAPHSPVLLWNIITGRQILKLPTHKKAIHAMTFSDTGRVIALASVTEIVLRKTATGEQIQKFDSPHGFGIAFSPDERWIAVHSSSNDLRLWDTTTGEMIQRIQEPSNGRQVAFSRDGKSLALNGSVYPLEWISTELRVLPPPDSLQVRGGWICNHERKLLWLPVEYRNISRSCVASYGKVLVIGQASGAVAFFHLQ